MDLWLEAGAWGLLTGGALLLGASVGYFGRLSPRLVAACMALGSGVLISALSFELMEEALARGGLPSTALGFLSGALLYTAANARLARRGARHRKRSGGQQPSEAQDAGSGLAIAIGALLDGIPESVALGISLLEGEGVSTVMLVALFLSNFPEGLSSASGMKRAGRSVSYVFGVWGGIALCCTLAAMVGCLLLADSGTGLIAAITAVAAGAILAMLTDTMIPEAFEQTHDFAGLITVAGFLAAFALSKASA